MHPIISRMKIAGCCWLLLLLLLGSPIAVFAEEGPGLDLPLDNGQHQPSGNPDSSGTAEENGAEDPTNRAPGSLWGTLFRLVVSFLLIVVLIYLFLRFLQTKSKRLYARGPMQMLGGCALGSNRSLQLVKVGDTLYILGVGEDVRLIRAIPKEEAEYHEIMHRFDEEREKSAAFQWKRWLNKDRSVSEASWDDVFSKELEDMQKDRERIESWVQQQPEDEKGKHT